MSGYFAMRSLINPITTNLRTVYRCARFVLPEQSGTRDLRKNSLVWRAGSNYHFNVGYFAARSLINPITTNARTLCRRARFVLREQSGTAGDNRKAALVSQGGFSVG
jgi:hypothetical protein